MKEPLLASLKKQGFSQPVLKAFEAIPRENFISRVFKSRAYQDRALPIGKGQTISQPYTIATMLDLLNLKPKLKVLEIGSGSGYVLALINNITKSSVYGVEVVKELAEFSKDNLADYKNIQIYNKNGKEGLKEKAPYDRIIISAAIEEVPKAVLNQLKPNGLLVAPVGVYGVGQDLTLIQRTSKGFITKKQIPGFVFVRFI